MPIDVGLVLPGNLSLHEVCAPLADELSRCFWVVDIQSGPFDSLWLYQSPENEALVDRQSWPVPAFGHTSTTGFRPGSLPLLADHLISDEYRYFFVIDAPGEVALPRATTLARHIGDLSENFLRDLGGAADLFLCDADGWWEIYCGRPDWIARLRAAWPDLRARPLSRGGKAPGAEFR